MWSVFPVEEIGPVVFDEHAWDHLVLEPETKASDDLDLARALLTTKQILIKSLVQVTRNSNTTSNIISDVITGKGGGLVRLIPPSCYQPWE